MPYCQKVRSLTGYMLYYMIQGRDENGNEAEEDVDTNDIDAKEESVLTNGKAHDAEPNKKRQKKR